MAGKVNKPRAKTADEVRAEPIIGQEAICPDGLGRVADYDFSMPNNYIAIDTYINNRQCRWSPDNVTLIDPMKGGS